MKREKLSLKGIKNVLSRTEMKKIMAGSNCIAEFSSCTPNPSYNPCCPGMTCLYLSGHNQFYYF